MLNYSRDNHNTTTIIYSEESEPTFVAEVIYHNYLSQVFPGSPLDDTVDCSHQCRPAFIMEDYHHTGGHQSVIIVPVLTPREVDKSAKSVGLINYWFPLGMLPFSTSCHS